MLCIVVCSLSAGATDLSPGNLISQPPEAAMIDQELATKQPAAPQQAYPAVRSVLVLLLLLAPMLAATLYWNRRLARSEKQLKRLDQLLQQSPDAIFVIRANDGKILQANPAAANSMGYSLQELLQLHVWEFSGRTDSLAQWQQLLPRLLAGKGTSFESSHRNKDGGLFPVEINAQHLSEPDGDLFIAIARDITDRKAADLALRESNDKYRALTETTQDFVWEVDADGRYTYCSPQTRQILGYPPEALLGRQPFELMPPQESQRVKALFGKAVAKRAPISNLVNVNLSSTGEQVILETSAQPFFDEHGALLGYRGIDRNISKRVQVETALKASESRFRELFDNMSDGVAMYTPVNGGDDFVFVDYNRAGERIGHNRRDVVVGRRVSEVFPGVEGIGLLDVFRRVFETGQPENYPLSFYQDNRVSLWVENYVFRIRDQEIVAIFRDITERKLAEDALKQSEARFRKIFERTDAISVQGYNRDHEVIYWNPASEQLYGYPAEQALGRKLEDLIIPQSMRDNVQSAISTWLNGGEAIPSSELTLQRADGSPVNVFSSHVMLRGATGEPEMYCIDIDLSGQKAANEQLRLLASVFTHAREGILITASDGTIIDSNQAFEKISGYSKQELVGNKPSILKSRRHPRAFYTQLWNSLLEEGYWSGEIWNRRKNGEIYAELITISSVRDASDSEVQHYVALCSDVTDQRLQQQRLEHIAHYDALTDLPNRVLLADRLKLAMVQEQRRGKLLAVAYLDLDGFKEINDEHGHELGDQLLQQLARRMLDALRVGDTIARIGGDEFVAVIIDLDHRNDAVQLLDRLMAAVSASVRLGDLELGVTASMGVTFFPQEEPIDADQLLRQGDQAMYKAKQSGKNRYHFFDAAHDRDLRGHHEILDNTRRALADNEFILYYQPKVNLRSGEVVGLEALIRWQHPAKGLLLPGDFLPFLENTPVAIEIDEWVINQARLQLEAWSASGIDLPVSVNVGAMYLQQADVVERLERLLADCSAETRQKLEFEVLETSALRDITHVAQVMERCKSLGIRFALDDFGIGYSTLDYLKRLPADQLKIDRTFVRDMLVDPDDLAILDGILGLATSFAREAIAEGVESVRHGEFLLWLGCEVIQGFGIAHAMLPGAFPVWLSQWKPDAAWKKIHSLRREDLPLLYAIVEHRAWVSDTLDACLRGVPSSRSRHLTRRFNNWLEEHGVKRFGSHPVFQQTVQLHKEIHDLVDALLKSSSTTRVEPESQQVDQLYRLRNRFTEKLRELILLVGSND